MKGSHYEGMDFRGEKARGGFKHRGGGQKKGGPFKFWSFSGAKQGALSARQAVRYVECADFHDGTTLVLPDVIGPHVLLFTQTV